MRSSVSLLVAFALCGYGTHTARADGTRRDTRAPEHGGTIRSLGQPQPWNFRVGASVGADFRKPEAAPVTYVEAGSYHDLAKPVLSALGLAVEGYFGFRGSDLDGGFRARLESPFLRLGMGYDQNLRDGAADFVLSFMHPFRRSGVFGHGTSVRVDWLPGRGHSFNVGIMLPLQRNMGSTRPRSDHVDLSSPSVPPVADVAPRPELAEALANVRDTAHWINRLTTPNFDQDGGNHRSAMLHFAARVQEIRQHLNSTAPFVDGKRTYAANVRAYHGELERAFSMVASDTTLAMRQSTPEGLAVTRKAREILLDQVIIPYNRLLGMSKKPDSTHPFGVSARGAFVRWLYTESRLNENRRHEVLYVFSEVLEIIERTRAWSQQDWDDSRFVWIPYQLALLPDDHDTQKEIDSLVERITREKFTPGNQVWYVVNEQFHEQFKHTIHETEDYHVLWIHDFRGVNSAGAPDSLSYEYVVKHYLPVLIRNVRRYDETAKLPVYMIFLDQYYYEANKGRLWMSLLENPMDHKLRLPARFKHWEGEIETAQAELRDAVCESELLQAEARQYGNRWLKNRIKVHVNITNPADPSFFSRQIIPLVGVPDNLMRDHRKIVFYDVAEEDPYKGEAIYTGMGLGEHYAGATWEDRALMVRGPAVLSLKRAARLLLQNQGFTQGEIPFPLQAREPADSIGYERGVKRKFSSAEPVMTGLQVHNQTGYRLKPINGLKATLYTLMPPGSLLKVPDSLWNNPLWAGMLAGAALRGARVFVIGPSRANAPSAGFPQMSRAYELFSRLVVLQKELRTEIETTGGLLKTGLYSPNVDVADVVERARLVVEGLQRHDFLREFVNLHTSVDSVFEHVGTRLEKEQSAVDRPASISAPRPVEPPKPPMLHLKSQLFVSWEAWNRLMASPDLAPMAHEYVLQVAQQVSRVDTVDVRKQARLLWSLARSAVDRAADLGVWPPDPTTLERDARSANILYLITGSQNMDYRGMLTDGEVAFVVSGYGSIVALFDFITLLGLSTWVEDVGALQDRLPAPSEWQRYVGRLIRTML